MNYQNPWMAKKGREETRLGWQNGSLDYYSFYAYLVVSTCSISLTPCWTSPFCSISPCAQPKQRCHGEGEDKVRTGDVEVCWGECSRSRGAHHREGVRRTGTCERTGGVVARGCVIEYWAIGCWNQWW